MIDPKPPESLDSAIAQASDAVAQQAAVEEAAIPVLSKWRVPGWVALVLVLVAGALAYWSVTRPLIPIDEESAMHQATLEQVRAGIEAFRDSTGRAPDSLDVIGFGFLQASYVLTDSVVRLAIPTSSGDSLRYEGPARRAQP